MTEPMPDGADPNWPVWEHYDEDSELRTTLWRHDDGSVTLRQQYGATGPQEDIVLAPDAVRELTTELDAPTGAPHGPQEAATAAGADTETPDARSGAQADAGSLADAITAMTTTAINHIRRALGSDETPAAGLRDRIAAALEAAHYRPGMRRGDLADAVMPVVHRLAKQTAQADLDRGDAINRARDAEADRDRLARTIDRMRSTNRMVNGAAREARERAEQAEGALAQFHNGEEPPTDEAVADTPATFIWRWNHATPQERHDLAARVLDAGAQAAACFIGDHDKQIANLRQRVDQAEATIRRVRALADDMRDWCSPQGYAVVCADRILAELDRTDTPQ